MLDNTAVATRTVKDIESKIASLGMLHELATTTEERLKSLNALAEHVTVKTKALETQRVTIDHAASEASRLNEMVWAMEAQIGKLEEGNRQVARAEEVLRQAEELAEEVQDELDAATCATRSVQRETARIEKDGAQLIQTVRAQIERLAIEGKSFDAHEQRIADLQGALDAAERQLEAVLGRRRRSSALDRKAEALGQTVRQLSTELGELSRRRAEVDALAERLARVEATAREAEARQARLESGRQQLEELRAELEAIHTSRASAAELCTPAQRRSGGARDGRREHRALRGRGAGHRESARRVLEKLRAPRRGRSDRRSGRERPSPSWTRRWRGRAKSSSSSRRWSSGCTGSTRSTRKSGGAWRSSSRGGRSGRHPERAPTRSARTSATRTRSWTRSARRRRSCRRFWNARRRSAATSSISRRA